MGRRWKARATAATPTVDRFAVISAAIQYPVISFLRFVLPLRVHYSGDVLLITDPEAARTWSSLAREYRVRLVTSVNCTRETLLTQRFVEYERLCAPPYTLCFATDFRDVYFQGDPFLSLLQGWGQRSFNASTTPALILALEHHEKPIGLCPFNRRRIWECYCDPLVENPGGKLET